MNHRLDGRPNVRNKNPDGTYKGGSKHGPKHRGEPGFWYKGRWFVPHSPFTADELRHEIPYTIPDDAWLHHLSTCECSICLCPQVADTKAEKIERMREILRKA